MEILLTALKTRGIKLPKFLLWKIVGYAQLELDYSRELAEYFHGEDTFKRALHRGKKLAERMAVSMKDSKLIRFGEFILLSGSAYFVLRISYYLTQHYGRKVFDRAVLDGNVSLLCALFKNHSYAVVYFDIEIVQSILEKEHVKMIEYLLDHDLLRPHSRGYNRSEYVLAEAVSATPKEIVVECFLQAVDDCPRTASVLGRYL